MKFKIPLYLKAFNSPFIRPSLKFYLGKTAIGVPYFLPRKWVKKKTSELMVETFGSRFDLKFDGKTYKERFDSHKRFMKAVPIKFGFSSCGLGWKTKFDSYRFESNPVWSFVAFGYQLAIIFKTEHPDQYWESFLYYHFETDKSQTWGDRVNICREKAPQKWVRYNGDSKEVKDYYNFILKEKWVKV